MRWLWKEFEMIPNIINQCVYILHDSCFNKSFVHISADLTHILVICVVEFLCQRHQNSPEHMHEEGYANLIRLNTQ